MQLDRPKCQWAALCTGKKHLFMRWLDGRFEQRSSACSCHATYHANLSRYIVLATPYNLLRMQSRRNGTMPKVSRCRQRLILGLCPYASAYGSLFSREVSRFHWHYVSLDEGQTNTTAEHPADEQRHTVEVWPDASTSPALLFSEVLRSRCCCSMMRSSTAARDTLVPHEP